MTPEQPVTLLCIASFHKGFDFLREAKRQGARVYLLTSESLKDADWPDDSIDDVFYIPDRKNLWKMDDMIKGVAYLARKINFDRIVALDDFDLEKAALLREHMRIPGMGDTRTRYFRDKLSMRTRAREEGIKVPDFVHVLNYDKLQTFMSEVPGPWILKPRMEAAALGIRKINHADELWEALDVLGDRQSWSLLERFVPGDIYHVDSIVFDHEVVFARTSKYGQPPMKVAHEGGIFTTHTLPDGSDIDRELQDLNQRTLRAMGLIRGVSHTEFIKAHEDGTLYFLETSARVGGAHVADMVEAATGVNLWAEWAKIECLTEDKTYHPPRMRDDHAGLIVSLARQEWPDTSAYNDPEIVWRLIKKHHAGLIVRSKDLSRVKQLLNKYHERFLTDFHASAPLPDSAAG